MAWTAGLAPVLDGARSRRRLQPRDRSLIKGMQLLPTTLANRPALLRGRTDLGALNQPPNQDSL